ncbi:MAG: choice-of-anchor D domain-containing protein [Verrucomicrobiales bacterium]|nr:choice-of-anchor D domain-containing protein [Verrucomicrobiales bacterium]
MKTQHAFSQSDWGGSAIGRAIIIWIAITTAALAQGSATLQHSLFSNTVLPSDVAGRSIAVDGNIAVVGVPAQKMVKVYNATTGVLLHLFEPVTSGPFAILGPFGEAVAISGTRIAVGAPSSGSDSKVLIYDLASATPNVPVATLDLPSIPNPSSQDDHFGRAVAISGTMVVVGAPQFAHGSATNPGRVFVFDIAGATPDTPLFTFSGPSALAVDFGRVVAISGSRIVVGTSGSQVFVFDMTSATPTVPVLTLDSNQGGTDNFGHAIGIDGNRIVVGASELPTQGSGSAYVYDVTSATPTAPVHTLTNPAEGVAFGFAVAISGTRVVVGGANVNSLETETTYVYDLANATPTTPVVTINDPGPGGDDQFGQAVALSGARLIIGAPHDDTIAPSGGIGYSYDLAGTTPTVPGALLNAPTPTKGDKFGISTAISGARVVVAANIADRAFVYDLGSITPTVPAFVFEQEGASAVDINGVLVAVGSNDAEQVKVFDLASATPTTPVLVIDDPNPGAFTAFGSCVAISGTRMVVGEPMEDAGGVDVGRAHVYDLASATPTVPVATLTNPAPADSGNFGGAVDISGTRFVVGAIGDATGADHAGIAYVYDLANATPTVPVVVLNNPAPAEYDVFGSQVAISGTRVAVAATGDDTTTENAGSVYIFDLAGATPAVPVLTLNNPHLVANETSQFGQAIALSGQMLVAGAIYGVAGRAYVYDFASTTPTVPAAILENPTPAQGDVFGGAVAADGGTFVVGAPQDDTIRLDKGAAYVFGVSPHSPEIDVRQPANVLLTDGAASVNFGLEPVGTNTSRTFTILNIGNTPLTGLGITLDGAGASSFSITASPVAPVPGPNGSTTFTVLFAATTGGVKSASLHIASNDADEAPFDIALTGRRLSFIEDGDGDGLNDASEFNLAALGFDWQLNQTALVNTYYANANGSGLYTPAQVQALHVGVPIIQRNAATGVFTLTIGVEKSTNLSTFAPFPMSAPQTRINGQGKLEFEFTVPDNAAFFRLEPP